MKIIVEFYKQSGKYYASGIAEIPDETELFTNDLYDLIMENQNCIRKELREFICCVSLPEYEQERLPTKFFKALIYESIKQNKKESE